MPIYEQEYSHWQGQLKSQTQSWLVIARSEIKMLWRKWMIILVIAALIPFLVRITQVILMNRFTEYIRIGKFMKMFAVNADMFSDFLEQQGFFVILMTIFSGSAIISKDKKFNALQLYFSKPLSYLEYLIGKASVVAFYICLTTFIPAMLLFITNSLLAEDTKFISEFYWLPFSITGYSLILITVYTGIILALSSLGKGARFAGISFFAIIGLTNLLKIIFSSTPEVGFISIGTNLKLIREFLFGLNPVYQFPLWQGLTALIAICLISFWILRKQIRAVEVVK